MNVGDVEIGQRLMIYRNLLASACALALLSWLFSRGWQRLPLFGCYLAAQMPLLIGNRPESAAWLNLWVWLEPLVVLLRVAAVGEAFAVHAKGTMNRLRLALALGMVAGMMLILIWTFVPGSPLQNIVQGRRLIQIGTLAFLGTYVALMWAVERLGAGWRLRHVLAVLALVLNHGTVSVASLAATNVLKPWTWDGWYLVNPISSSVSAIVLAVWAVLWWKGRREA